MNRRELLQAIGLGFLVAPVVAEVTPDEKEWERATAAEIIGALDDLPIGFVIAKNNEVVTVLMAGSLQGGHLACDFKTSGDVGLGMFVSFDKDYSTVVVTERWPNA